MNEFYIINRQFESEGTWYAEGIGDVVYWSEDFDSAHKFKTIPEIQEYISVLLKKPDLFMPLELNTWVITRYSSNTVNILDIITEAHTMGLLRGGVE